MGSTQTAVRPRSTGFTPLPPSPPPPPPEVSKAAEHLEGERIQIIGKASVAAGQVDFFPSAWFSKMGCTAFTALGAALRCSEYSNTPTAQSNERSHQPRCVSW